MIYANNAGTSWPKPNVVQGALTAALVAGPAEADDRFASARDEVCRFLGIRDPERFLFTGSCTQALSLALSDLPWEAGDVVLTSSLEHHALARPVRQLETTRGVRHVAAPYRPGTPVDLDFVRDTLRRGGVRLVAMTAASNVTGELLPIREVAELAHEQGARLLVDAAQTVGIVPVNVVDLGADLLVFAGHKGPLGPHGVGGLWAATHVAFDSPSAACEIVADPSSRPGCVAFPGYCDVGSVNLAGIAGLAAGLRWLADSGFEATGSHARALADELRGQLRTREKCRVLGGGGPHTATVSMTIDGMPLAEAEAHFRRHGIVVRAGEHCAAMALEAIGAVGGTLRISFGPSNSARDVAEILDVIDSTI